MTTQEAVSGPQREPDERVREALEWADKCPNNEDNATYLRALAAEVRRLQAAQREPVAWQARARFQGGPWGEWMESSKDFHDSNLSGRDQNVEVRALYTHPQRDDHPTEGLLRDLDALLKEPGHILYQQAYAMLERCRAALAASKDKPDMGHGQPLPSLSGGASVADLKHHLDQRCMCALCESRTKETYLMAWFCANCETKGDALIRNGDRPNLGAACPHCGVSYRLQYSAPDAAMSADVRSQAQDTKRQGDDQRRERGEIKPCPVHEACSDSCAARPKETR